MSDEPQRNNLHADESHIQRRLPRRTHVLLYSCSAVLETVLRTFFPLKRPEKNDFRGGSLSVHCLSGSSGTHSRSDVLSMFWGRRIAEPDVTWAGGREPEAYAQNIARSQAEI